MPRAQQSKASTIVNYFRTEDLGVAETVLGLAQDAVKERKQRSTDAKARAAKASVAAAVQPAAPKPKAKKKARKRKATAAQVDDLSSPTVDSID